MCPGLALLPRHSKRQKGDPRTPVWSKHTFARHVCKFFSQFFLYLSRRSGARALSCCARALLLQQGAANDRKAIRSRLCGPNTFSRITPLSTFQHVSKLFPTKWHPGPVSLCPGLALCTKAQRTTERRSAHSCPAQTHSRPSHFQMFNVVSVLFRQNGTQVLSC